MTVPQDDHAAEAGVVRLGVGARALWIALGAAAALAVAAAGFGLGALTAPRPEHTVPPDAVVRAAVVPDDAGLSEVRTYTLGGLDGISGRNRDGALCLRLVPAGPPASESGSSSPLLIAFAACSWDPLRPVLQVHGSMFGHPDDAVFDVPAGGFANVTLDDDGQVEIWVAGG